MGVVLVSLRIVYSYAMFNFRNFRLRCQSERLKSPKIKEISPKQVNVYVVRVPVSRLPMKSWHITLKNNYHNFVYFERNRPNGDFRKTLNLNLSIKLNSTKNFCCDSSIKIIKKSVEGVDSSRFPNIEA
jgi:hypothetical protein